MRRPSKENDEIKAKTKEGIRKCLQTLNLTLSSTQKANLHGREWHAANSASSYMKQYRGLRRFLGLYGDYESMLMLEETFPLEFCPAMNVNSLILYIRYKTTKAGSILKLDGCENAVKDVLGREIECEGSWSAKINIEQFVSAINVLHQSFGHGQSYTEPCNTCIELFEAGDKSGCRLHSKRQMWRTGKPLSHITFTNEKKAIFKRLTHTPSTAAQLSPDEMKRLRMNLLNSGKVEDFSLFVMSLVGVRLLLRFGDVCNIKVEDIVQELCVITEKGIQSLAFRIQGKTEKRVTLWADEKVPELCPIRHLMAYIYLMGIKGGYLFPSVSEMYTKPKDGLFTTKRQYSTFNADLRTTLSNLTGRDKAMFTTDTLKKTGVLFAVWGGATETEILQSCRHRHVQTVVRYMQDAKYMFEIAQRSGTPTIPTWTVTFCKDAQSGTFKNYGSIGKFKSLDKLASDFVIDCGMTLDHPLSKVPVEIFDYCLRYQRRKTIAEELDEIINAIEDPKLKESLRTSISRFVSDLTKNLYAESLKQTSNSTYNKAAGPAPLQRLHNCGKRKRGSDIELAELREKFKTTKNLEEKLSIIKQFIEQQQIHGAQLSNAVRTLITKQAKPILNCFTSHFNENIEAFSQQWGKIVLQAPSQFTLKCCKGKSNISCM